jgi:carboxymethylenebutenolidase
LLFKKGKIVPDLAEVKLYEDYFELDMGQERMPVYTAGPKDSKAYPGLIVIHEIFGFNDHIADLARRFARTGMRVFAPDLFSAADRLRLDRNDLDSMRKLWSGIADAHIIEALQKLLVHIRAEKNVVSDQIGVIGYCMGGAIAFMFAGETKELAFVCDYYGRIQYPQLSEDKPKHPIDYASGINCPVLGLFSKTDELIPLEQVNALESRLKELGKTTEFKVYDAPHAFFNDTREHYDKDAAEDAWTRTLAFIDKAIRT